MVQRRKERAVSRRDAGVPGQYVAPERERDEVQNAAAALSATVISAEGRLGQAHRSLISSSSGEGLGQTTRGGRGFSSG